MARYRGTVASPYPAADIWSYLADLRSVSEWDPSVEDVRITSGDPGMVGTRYELEVSFLGRGLSLPYVTVAVDPPTRLVFAAETESISVRDEAQIRPLATGGSSVVWDAELRLNGARRLFDPVLRLAFNRLGARAERGLRQRLNQVEMPGSLKGVAA